MNAIAFDLWETLITDSVGASRQQERLRLERMEAILTRAGHAVATDRVAHAYRALWHRAQDLYWSLDRDIPCRRQIELFVEELALHPEEVQEPVLAELEHVYAHAALELLPHPVDGAEETLAALKQQGLRIGLISNTGRTPGSVLRPILEKLGLGAAIDVMVFSNEHGHCKPQPSIFEELRRALDVRYDEMVFVGDNLYADVHGAQRCGMRAIHFDPPVRGTAVAPHFEHGLEIVADARVTRLPEVVEVVGRWKGEG